VKIDKDMVIEFIKSKVGDDEARRAERELPERVDTEKDAGLLSRFGIDAGDLLDKLPGGLGDKLDTLPGGLGKKLDDLL
jgi:hypothetical protein